MKKIVLIGANLLLLMILTGCSTTQTLTKNIDDKLPTVNNTQTVKTEKEIMQDVVNDAMSVDPTTYKIFDKVNSPDGQYTALLAGPDPDKDKHGCCTQPGEIMIIQAQNDVLTDYFDRVRGDRIHLYIRNAQWINNNKLSYEYVSGDEGGENAQTRYFEIK